MMLYWVLAWLQDMVLYSVFAFLYLVGTSLVASAFDFYQKMKTNVSSQTVHQLVIVVVCIHVWFQGRIHFKTHPIIGLVASTTTHWPSI